MLCVRPENPTGYSADERWTVSYLRAEAENVLYLPTEAMRSVDGESCVYILDESGLITTKIVTAGITGGGMTQILSGLEEGQQVHALVAMGYPETEPGAAPPRKEVEELVRFI